MKKYITSLTLIVFLLLSPFSYVFAQDYLEAKSLAIALVIDTSESMEDTDPQRLRQSVVDVFIDYLHPNDYLGIITFNSGVDLVIPIAQLQSDGLRSTIKETVAQQMEGSGDTDYRAALVEASKELDSIQDLNAKKIIILITDGEPYPGTNYLLENDMETYLAGLWTDVATLASKQYPIHAIGFSEGLDVEVLNRMASETSGNVQVYENGQDLDTNLIQLLKSREAIVQEILEPPKTISEVKDLQPTLSAESWFSPKGYRIGEKTVVSASIMSSNMRVKSGGNLFVNSFGVMIQYDDGTQSLIPLFDDGALEHSDILANDGLWANQITFTTTGLASAKLILSGTLNEEPLNISKDIGGFKVADPGVIVVTQKDIAPWVTDGGKLNVGVTLTNHSEFAERLSLQLDESFGTLSISSIELEPNVDTQLSLQIKLNEKLEVNRIHPFSLSLIPEELSTSINQTSLQYSVEVISGFEGFTRNFEGNYVWIIGVLLTLLGILFIVLLFGIIFYGVLVAPHQRVRGTLTYWHKDQVEVKGDINLSKMKKNKIRITLNDDKSSDYQIISDQFAYSLILYTKMIKKQSKIMLGWMTFLTRKPIFELIVETTQPGIIEYHGSILTQKNLTHGDVFISGDICFKYTSKRQSKIVKQTSGKDILEGRV